MSRWPYALTSLDSAAVLAAAGPAERFARTLAYHRPGRRGAVQLLGAGSPLPAEATALVFEAHAPGLAALVVAARARGLPTFELEASLSHLRGRVPSSPAELAAYLSRRAEGPGRNHRADTTFDFLALLCAGLLLLASLPLFILIGSALRFSGSPVFYAQERLGRHGQRFRLWKFCTMRPDAEAGGPRWARVNDDRVTALGRWLRLSHLDELPQLWNVLRGEMRFIGPRPERAHYYELLARELPSFALRLNLSPGITGWAQVTQGYASSVEESRAKLEADLYYLLHRSWRMDAWILLQTARKFLPRPRAAAATVTPRGRSVSLEVLGDS